MRWFQFIFAVALAFGLRVSAFAAEHAGEGHEGHADAVHAAVAGHAAHAAGEEHSLPPTAARLLGDHSDSIFQISNSLVAMIIVAAGMIIFAQLATRKTQLIPSGLQNFAEWIVESLLDFLGSIMGPQLARKTFWFYATVFLFILGANWFGLFPGVGSIGYGHDTDHGFQVDHPILRGANADFNMTFALACMFFLLWIFWSIRANGIGGFFSHIFVYHGDAAGWIRPLLYLIFFLVGFLEVISIMIRPVSLTFRLYGNIYAGESLLEKMMHMGGPMFGWLAALPFFGLELLVGMIQALVFMLLTAVFTALMCQHGGDEGEHGEGGHSAEEQASH
jgi:F-type H+-transporting ATPase subunit a